MEFIKEITIHGIKRTITVFLDHLYNAKKQYDLMLCSAFKGDYYPLPGTVIHGLFTHGVSVEGLAENPEINGKDFGFWISKEIDSPFCKRIGCIEFIDYTSINQKNPLGIFSFMENVISYHDKNIHIKSVATPLLGTGQQNLSYQFVVPVLIKTILNSFENNDELEDVSIFAISEDKYNILVKQLDSLFKETFDVFISYSSKQKDEASQMCSLLRDINLKTWFDSNIIQGGESYLEKIPSGIQNSKVFLLLLTPDAESSPWVSRELQTAINCHKYIVPYVITDHTIDIKFDFMLSDVQRLDSNKISQQEIVAFINRKVSEIKDESSIH